MSEVVFHFNVPDQLAYSCRLLRKAVAGGAKLIVSGPSATLYQLDLALWSLSETDFVAHCLNTARPEVLQHSPVLLLESAQFRTGYGTLVNLCDALPQPLSGFTRVIEIVTKQESARRLARQRWKQYCALGWQVTRHDVAPAGSAAAQTGAA